MKIVISTQNAPAAIGPYSQAIEANGMVFISGQLPIDPLTGELVTGGVKEQATQCFRNIRANVYAGGITPEKILNTTVFLGDMSLFSEMNEVYAQQFDGAFPARSAIAAKGLPRNCMVEIEAIAVR
jgi:2-iminobutanoate/2-iminopropanoate deaminase